MADEADVRPVDPHPKGARGHRHRHLAPHEQILRRLALGLRKPGVVGAVGDVVLLQLGGDGLHTLARGAVNDTRAVLPDQRAQAAGFVDLAGELGDVKAQVVPGESGDEDRGLLQPELALDILAHIRGGRGGKGRTQRTPDLPQDLAQAHVVGPEVVPPLADAVRLVDGEHGDLGRLQRPHEAARPEALRGDIHELERAPAHTLQHLALLIPALRAVNHGRRDAASLKSVHLVLHQRDQRRDHQCDPVHHQRGQLVAEALAAPGGHDHQRVPPLQNAGHHLLLRVPEIPEPEMLLQYLSCLTHPAHRSARPFESQAERGFCTDYPFRITAMLARYSIRILLAGRPERAGNIANG